MHASGRVGVARVRAEHPSHPTHHRTAALPQRDRYNSPIEMINYAYGAQSRSGWRVDRCSQVLEAHRGESRSESSGDARRVTREFPRIQLVPLGRRRGLCCPHVKTHGRFFVS